MVIDLWINFSIRRVRGSKYHFLVSCDFHFEIFFKYVHIAHLCKAYFLSIKYHIFQMKFATKIFDLNTSEHKTNLDVFQSTWKFEQNIVLNFIKFTQLLILFSINSIVSFTFNLTSSFVYICLPLYIFVNIVCSLMSIEFCTIIALKLTHILPKKNSSRCYLAIRIIKTYPFLL